MQSVYRGDTRSKMCNAAELPNLTRAESQCHLYLSVRVDLLVEALLRRG